MSAKEVEELRAKAKERDQFLDQLQRSKAELANYQKRVERDRETWSQEAVARFVARLIPFLDDVERALAAVREGKDFGSVERGLEMMEKSFHSLLTDQGVKPIAAVGLPFDPRQHEAVAQRVDQTEPDGTVLVEIQKGYTMGGRVLRPAQVIVSRETDDASETPAEGN
ncbi:MAG: nucleotide exchange factor GrpE [Planctomycetes bacterium]|nr:nucleotide exchange factor GrpE [Planctomycetota bacterium]